MRMLVNTYDLEEDLPLEPDDPRHFHVPKLTSLCQRELAISWIVIEGVRKCGKSQTMLPENITSSVRIDLTNDFQVLLNPIRERILHCLNFIKIQDGDLSQVDPEQLKVIFGVYLNLVEIANVKSPGNLFRAHGGMSVRRKDHLMKFCPLHGRKLCPHAIIEQMKTGWRCPCRLYNKSSDPFVGASCICSPFKPELRIHDIVLDYVETVQFMIFASKFEIVTIGSEMGKVCLNKEMFIEQFYRTWIGPHSNIGEVNLMGKWIADCNLYQLLGLGPEESVQLETTTIGVADAVKMADTLPDNWRFVLCQNRMRFYRSFPNPNVFLSSLDCLCDCDYHHQLISRYWKLRQHFIPNEPTEPCSTSSCRS